METSLHRTPKERYAAGGTERREVVIERFRVDAVDDIGRLVEVQFREPDAAQLVCPNHPAAKGTTEH